MAERGRTVVTARKIKTGYGFPKKPPSRLGNDRVVWTAYFVSLQWKDFQDSPDDEEDTRSSQEYLNYLEEEYQERALLAKSTRFFKKGPSQQKPELRPNKDFEAKYNKVKAKLALFGSSTSSKSSMVKNKGLVVEAYERDEEDLSSDVNEMTEVKVLMAHADYESVVMGKESARNGEWVKISIKKVHTLLDMEDNDERKSFLDYFCIDLNYVEEQRSNLVLKHRDLVQELNTCKEHLLVLKQAKLDFLTMQRVNIKIIKENKNLRKNLKKLITITETWLNSSNKVNQCISEQIPSQKKRILGLDQLTEDPSSFRQTDLVFVKSSADYTKVSIPGIERPWLSKAKGFTLPNHDTGRILQAESQVQITNPLVAITDSSATKYDLVDESLVCSTPLPPLEKLAGVEPVSGPKTIKSILNSNSTFTAETLKGVTINEPSSASAKGNKNGPSSKNNSAPAGKLKNVKTEDDSPLSIIMKELNDLKLQISKNRSSYSRNNKSQQVPQNALQNKYKTQFKRNYKLCGLNNHLSENCYKVLFCKKYERTNHRTCEHAEYMSAMNMTQHLKSQGGSSSRSKTSRPSKPFPLCIHYGFNDHLSDECVNYPICDICESYDHDTHSYNRFRRGKALQAMKAKAFEFKKTESSNVHRSKTPTKRHMNAVKCYLHKYVEQLGPKVLFGDDSTYITEGYVTINVMTEAIATACYTQNRSTIVKRHLKTPYEIFRGRIPNIDLHHVFGCPVYIHNHKDYLGKFDEKANDGYFFGYSLVSKAFRVFNTRRQQTKETYHITFDESTDAIKFTKPLDDNVTIVESDRYPPDEYLHPCSPRARMLIKVMAKELSDVSAHECLFVDFLSKEEPKKVFEALKHLGWVDSMQEELNQFSRNKV
ncbi:retrovirus-related pol polyprotein from transposon TNT 1-94 [Tanacetum coccineum]